MGVVAGAVPRRASGWLPPPPSWLPHPLNSVESGVPPPSCPLLSCRRSGVLICQWGSFRRSQASLQRVEEQSSPPRAVTFRLLPWPGDKLPPTLWLNTAHFITSQPWRLAELLCLSGLMERVLPAARPSWSQGPSMCPVGVGAQDSGG